MQTLQVLREKEVQSLTKFSDSKGPSSMKNSLKCCVFLGCELFMINTKLFIKASLLMKKCLFQYPNLGFPLENSQIKKKKILAGYKL